MGLSYVLIALVSGYSAAEHMRASWLWLTFFFVLMTTGELFILPVGLGFFGRLAPRGFEATAIATWFFAGFAGNLLAGGLGVMWSFFSRPVFFAVIATTAFIAALLLLFFVRAGTQAEQTSKLENQGRTNDEDCQDHFVPRIAPTVTSTFESASQ